MSDSLAVWSMCVSVTMALICVACALLAQRAARQAESARHLPAVEHHATKAILQDLINDGMCPCCQSTLGREALWVDPKVGPPERVILQDLIAELRDCGIEEIGIRPSLAATILGQAEQQLKGLSDE